MFSWATKKKSSDGKGTDRKSQLAEFKASFPAHRKPNNDDSIMEVVFSCQSNLAILRIYITEEFPVQRPVFQVIGDSTHPWIDSFKRVTGAPLVNNWSVLSGSNLTKAVHEIINTLSEPLVGQALCQPETCHSTDHVHGVVSVLNHSSSSGEVRVGEDISTIHIDANTNTAATARDKNMDNTGPNNPDMNRVKQQQQQDSQYFTRMPIPPIPVSFPNLHDMNEISLQRLLNDPHALELHVEQRSEIKELENMRDMLALQSAQQAEHNLKQIEALDSQRAVLLPDQYELKEAVSMYKKKQEEYMKRYSVGKEQILSDIRKYQNELSTLTDNLGEDFIKGKKQSKEFLREYINARKQYHEYTVKLKQVTGANSLP